MRFLRTVVGLPLASTLVLACGGTVSNGPSDAAIDDSAVARDSAVAPDGAKIDSGTSIDAASPSQDAGPPDPCCLNPGVTWATLGGFVAFEESSALASCNQYSHHRKFPAGGSPALDCTQPMACVADALGMSDVSAALKDADVAAAIAKAPVLYGYDARVSDGQILEVTIGSAVIQIGMECTGQPGCVEIPTGVAALAKLLRTVDGQETGRGDCATVFTP